jgi:hypothetical protein
MIGKKRDSYTGADNCLPAFENDRFGYQLDDFFGNPGGIILRIKFGIKNKYLFMNIRCFVFL